MVSQEKISQYLSRKGIRPLEKRVKVMEYLISRRNHPTVDIIYNDLRISMPGLSKTTVYNVLKLFVEKGAAITIGIEDNEVRFDADTSTHGHFKCSVCGGVFDFRVDPDQLPHPELPGFICQEYHYYIKGICSLCAENSLSE